jgi:hypothetical protein
MIPITETITTFKQLADVLASKAKEQKWHVFCGTVEGKDVRVKVYGCYLQIFDVDGVRYGGGMHNTQRQLKADVLRGAV